MSNNTETVETTENTENTEAVENPIEVVVTNLVAERDLEEWTPYAIHSSLNQLFEAAGSDRRIVPQMMYNYSRNALIAKRDKHENESGKMVNSNHRYTSDEVAAFLIKYVTKHTK